MRGSPNSLVQLYSVNDEGEQQNREQQAMHDLMAQVKTAGLRKPQATKMLMARLGKLLGQAKQRAAFLGSLISALCFLTYLGDKLLLWFLPASYSFQPFFVLYSITSAYMTLEYLQLCVAHGWSASYLFSLSGLLDLLSSLPTIVGLALLLTSGQWTCSESCFSPVFTLVRILTVVRMYKLSRLETFIYNHTAKRAFLFFVQLLTTIVLFSALVSEIERENIVDSAYFSVISVTTVGYGDITANTYFIRLCVVVFVLAMMILIPMQSNQIFKVSEERSTYRQRAQKTHSLEFKGSQHVVLCGPVVADLKAFLDEFFHTEHGSVTEKVVVISRNRQAVTQMNLMMLNAHRAHSLVHIDDSSDSCRGQGRSGMHRAKRIYILSDSFSCQPFIDDQRAILTCVSIIRQQQRVFARQREKWHRNSKLNQPERPQVFVKVLLKKSEKILHNLLALESPCRSPSAAAAAAAAAAAVTTPNVRTFCVEEARLRMFAQSCICPGFNAFLTNILLSCAGQASAAQMAIREALASVRDQGDSGHKEWKENPCAHLSWEDEYEQGKTYEIYKAELGDHFRGVRFAELARILYRYAGMIPVAISICDGGSETLLLSPSELVLPSVFELSVFVMAFNKEHVAMLSNLDSLVPREGHQGGAQEYAQPSSVSFKRIFANKTGLHGGNVNEEAGTVMFGAALGNSSASPRKSSTGGKALQAANLIVNSHGGGNAAPPGVVVSMVDHLTFAGKRWRKRNSHGHDATAAKRNVRGSASRARISRLAKSSRLMKRKQTSNWRARSSAFLVQKAPAVGARIALALKASRTSLSLRAALAHEQLISSLLRSAELQGGMPGAADGPPKFQTLFGLPDEVIEQKYLVRAHPSRQEDVTIRKSLLEEHPHIRNHIIACLDVSDFTPFLMPLRERVAGSSIPVVLVTTEPISDYAWKRLAYFPDVYICRGIVNVTETWRKAGVKFAARVVLGRKHTGTGDITSSSSSNKSTGSTCSSSSSPADAAANAVATTAAIDGETVCLFNSITRENPQVQIFCELESKENVNFLSSRTSRFKNEECAPAICGGNVFTSELFDALLARSAHDSSMLDVFQVLSGSGMKATIHEENGGFTQSSFFSINCSSAMLKLTFFEVFDALAKHGVIAVAIRRGVQPRIGIGIMGNKHPYVVNNPMHSAKLYSADQIICLSQRDPYSIGIDSLGLRLGRPQGGSLIDLAQQPKKSIFDVANEAFKDHRRRESFRRTSASFKGSFGAMQSVLEAFEKTLNERMAEIESPPPAAADGE